MRTAYAFAALSQSGDRNQLYLTTGDVCLQIGLSVKRSYWLKLTSLGPPVDSNSGHAGISSSTKYVRHEECDTKKCDVSVLFYEIHA